MVSRSRIRCVLWFVMVALAFGSIAVLGAMSGCAAVGHTDITYPTPAGPVIVRTTKDEILKDFHLHSKRLADGSVELSIDAGNLNGNASSVDSIQAQLSLESLKLTNSIVGEALKHIPAVPVAPVVP